MRKKKKTIPARNDTSVKKKRVYKKKAAVAKKARKGAAPKVRNAGTWSEAQYFQKVRSILRNGFRWWLPMSIALKKVSRPSEDKTNKRVKVEYQCAKCLKWMQRRLVQIDHVEECGSLSCYEDIVPFLQRLTKESSDSFQVLCKPCHSVKTKLYLENKKKIPKIVKKDGENF